MQQIFMFLGSLFGYVLWFAFLLVKNYGWAILLFTLLFKLLFLPMSIKQQKQMAVTSKLTAKQNAIREKYANNKEKMNEEIQKLYEKENASPFSGCLTSFLPMFLLLGLFYSIGYPLTNTLHLGTEKVNELVNYVSSIPGISGVSGMYSQIEFIKIFPSIQSTDFIQNLLTPAEIDKIMLFSKGFNLFGLDLLSTPRTEGFSALIIIPVLCLVSSIGTQVIMTKLQGTSAGQQGCMKLLLYGMPLFTAYIAYTVPAAVGIYWIISTVLSGVQSIVLQRWYNPSIMGAKAEAQRIAYLEIEEAKAQKIK